MKLLMAVILALFSTSLWAADCETHQICTLDQPCECRIPASSAYDRYYYLNMPEVKKGHIYSCSFKDSMGIISADLDKSTFPVGSNWQLQSNSPHFPFTLMLDTNYMDDDATTVIVRYFVPGSDMPTTILAMCITVA